jgi:DNA-binding transcriptional MerR regulator
MSTTRKSTLAKFVASSFTPDDKDVLLSDEFTINQLATRLAISHRALRFYESRGLIAPRRAGRKRFYNEEQVGQLEVIVRLKKYRFTLAEIKAMTQARVDPDAKHAYSLSREKCLSQIALLEQQRREISEALQELRALCTTMP